LFLVDDTVCILEKPHHNTGIKPGAFLSRTKAKKNRPRFELGEVSEFYQPRDYFIGNTLELNGFQFVLTGAADEFTLQYMEEHKHAVTN
jgi:hypothetical protein